MSIENHHRQPCARCGHRDMHGEVSGCVHVDAGTWCDCDTYVEPTGRVIPSRRTDPATSHQAAAAIVVKATNQRGRLLLAHAAWSDRDQSHEGGLTDEEAASLAEGVSLTSEYAKRCSELRDAGLIEATGQTRKGASGAARIISRITEAGRTAAKGL